jgi:MFS family permease
MASTIQIIFFLHWFATGIISPVLALALMAHGATIDTVSLLIGAYSTTVVITEFPSGVLADIFGQKKAFLLSALCAMLCFGLVLVSQSLPMLMAAMICMGLSRAFSSGTLDVLAVNLMQVSNEQHMLKHTSRFAILESTGLAAGALIGGLMAEVGKLYNGIIFTSLGIYCLVFLLTLLLIRENHIPIIVSEYTSLRSLIGGQIKDSFEFLLQKGVVRVILLVSVATGFALIAVETYWQPTFDSFDPPSWALGIVSAGGFLSVVLGSKLIMHIMRKHMRHALMAYLLQRAIFGVGLIGLFLVGDELPFLAIYMLSYAFLGGGGVAETTLIHLRARDDQRSSILSLFSFIAQLGGILASITGYFVSTNSHYKRLWLIAGVLLIICSTCMMLLPRLVKNRRSA